jgi:hypothetical protein
MNKDLTRLVEAHKNLKEAREEFSNAVKCASIIAHNTLTYEEYSAFNAANTNNVKHYVLDGSTYRLKSKEEQRIDELEKQVKELTYRLGLESPKLPVGSVPKDWNSKSMAARQ